MNTEIRSLYGAHGNTIVYDVHRPDSEPVGVVVIVHGLGEHGSRYGHVAQALTDAGYVVIVPDHAGHGRSGGKRLGVTDFGDFADDVNRVIGAVERAGLPLLMLGHSMGGAIALDYALRYPDELAGLVLSGPAVVPGDDLSPALIAIAPVLGRLLPGLPTTALSAAAVSRDPAVVADYEADPMVAHGPIPAGLGGALIATMTGFPARLPALDVPLLVLHGGDDQLANPAGSELVAEYAGSEDLTLIIYPGLYHEILNEPEQDEVIAEIIAWLQAHTA